MKRLTFAMAATLALTIAAMLASPSRSSAAAQTQVPETVVTIGDAPFFGSTAGAVLNKPLVGMAARPSGDGYWQVASDGGIFSFGQASFRGSTGAIALNQPIVGMAATPTGNGYWLAASDGGVFAFGDAQFYGSMGATKLIQPVVAIAPTPSGHGYWMVASDGGIFSFGDAGFFGSLGALRLVQPIVGMAATPSGRGYVLAAADGGVFTFGDAIFYGSLGATTLTPGRPIVAVAARPQGNGYWLIDRVGQLAGFGAATKLGPAVTITLTPGTVVGAVATSTGMGLWEVVQPYSGPLTGLAGRTILVDPGHNGGNNTHPEIINQTVFVGNIFKACDTTGTETNDGYPEYAFTWDVAIRLRAILESAGATVVFTHPDDTGVGPCITERAAIGNRAHADVAISIHGDGGPANGRGFHVLYPALLPGLTDDILPASQRLGVDVRSAFEAATPMPRSTYITGGLVSVDYLGGLNLSDVPKVFIECGNMRNATDAELMKDSAFRQMSATGIANAMAAFLRGE